MKFCPDCGREYTDAIAACPQCRVVLGDEPPLDDRSGSPIAVHSVPDAASGALLCGVLENSGIRTMLQPATLPGYGAVRRDWTTSHWGEIIVASGEAEEARAIIADYLGALEAGGVVRDEDVEGQEP